MARILVVEDEESVVRLLTHALRDAGHTPLAAPTGYAALLAAQAHPDLILLDLGLPDMSGEEVLRRLKRDPGSAQIPVVVVSGDPGATDRVPRGGAAGALAILQKPVLGSELCAAVDIVLDAQRHGTGGMAEPMQAGDGALHGGQAELLYRLIRAGSEPLVRQVCRRIGTDRARGNRSGTAETASWTEIIRRAKQEGLLADEDGRALLHGGARRPAEGTA